MSFSLEEMRQMQSLAQMGRARAEKKAEEKKAAELEETRRLFDLEEARKAEEKKAAKKVERAKVVYKVQPQRGAVLMGKYNPASKRDAILDIKKALQAPHAEEEFSREDLLQKTVRFFESEVYGDILEGVIVEVRGDQVVIENEYGRWDSHIESFIIVETQEA